MSGTHSIRIVQDKSPIQPLPRNIKPWMKQRLNETDIQWRARINRTCYKCGKEYSSTGKKLDSHEQQCRKH